MRYSKGDIRPGSTEQTALQMDARHDQSAAGNHQPKRCQKDPAHTGQRGAGDLKAGRGHIHHGKGKTIPAAHKKRGNAGRIDALLRRQSGRAHQQAEPTKRSTSFGFPKEVLLCASVLTAALACRDTKPQTASPQKKPAGMPHAPVPPGVRKGRAGSAS